MIRTTFMKTTQAGTAADTNPSMVYVTVSRISDIIDAILKES